MKMIDALAPFTLGTLNLRNHIIRSATVDPHGNLDGSVSEEQINLYRRLANNQVGLIITGMVSVDRDGRVNQVQNSLDNDSFLPGHAKLTDAVHQAGGKIVMQISHCGAESITENPISPSGIASPYTKKPCREMKKEEIRYITEAFTAASLRAKEAGYDGVQIHCAHGYLLSQFINPMFNKRTDEYGGTIENRFRIIEEILTAVRKAVGPDYFLSIKINSNLEEADEQFVDDLLWIGRKSKAMGIQLMEISGYDFVSQGRAGKHNYYLERASVLRKEAEIPVALVGGIRSLNDMEEVLRSGIDMVSMSRPFICQEDLIVQYLAGQESASCTSCSKCFGLDRKYKETGVRCILHKAH